MILHIKPVSVLKGQIQLPSSKSYSIRASIIGAFGQSQIKNISNCDDSIVAKRIAKALKNRASTFLVGESGTTLRFLLPLLPLYVSKATVQGKGTLIGRPNTHLCQTLRECGMDIKGNGPKESVPISFKGGQIKGGVIKIDGSLSSQFISALLIAAPRFKEDSKIIITGKEMVSKDYIIMTLLILAKAGIKIKQLSEREFLIKGNQTFKGLKNFIVPSDYGLAAFPMAAASLLSSKVVLKGHLKDDLIQSDGHILEFLKKMGVRFKKTTSSISLQGPFNLKGGKFSLKNCPDLVPIMAVLGLFAKGQTQLMDVFHARVKESDRISDVRTELLKVGADVEETSNALIINPQASYKSGQILNAHNDHRLAMAWTVLGMKIGCSVQGVESCRKSYPDFVKDMRLLGLTCMPAGREVV
jgi:3-phosphoshikimate 1-carboxyvinyltransferase